MTTWRYGLCGVTIAVVVLAMTALTAHAQGRVTGKFTDKWDNPIVGAEVFVEPSEGTTGARQDTTTDENGEYAFLGLGSGRWEVEVHADGYQPVRAAEEVRLTSSSSPLELELEVLPSGGRFRGDTEFEAEGGVPKIKFSGEGEFEFEDSEGEGEGTYGIVELSAVLVVRDYDGPDDKYTLSDPVVVIFPTDQFLSATWGETRLNKK